MVYEDHLSTGTLNTIVKVLEDVYKQEVPGTALQIGISNVGFQKEVVPFIQVMEDRISLAQKENIEVLQRVMAVSMENSMVQVRIVFHHEVTFIIEVVQNLEVKEVFELDKVPEVVIFIEAVN